MLKDRAILNSQSSIIHVGTRIYQPKHAILFIAYCFTRIYELSNVICSLLFYLFTSIHPTLNNTRSKLPLINGKTFWYYNQFICLELIQCKCRQIIPSLCYIEGEF